jgi:15-cis-phytoene synthase
MFVKLAISLSIVFVLSFPALGQNGPDCNDMAEGVDPITEAKEKVGSSELGWKMASRFMKKETRESVLTLYTWLRHVDDLVDEAPSIDEAMRNLEQSKLYVKEIFADSPSADPLLLAMQDLVKRHGIPQGYFNDFLIGMEMDVRNVHYRTIEDLEGYCYGVSVVIGLILGKIMKVTDPRALPHILGIGHALQMTNIARDVKDDFTRGRVYLPEDWLAQEGLSRNTLMNPESSSARMRVVKRLLDRAAFNYRIADAGYKYIPMPERIAIASAGRLYEEIGAVILKQGDVVSRARVPSSRKKALFLKSVFGSSLRHVFSGSLLK